MYQKRILFFLLSISALSYLFLSFFVIKQSVLSWDNRIFAIVEKITVFDEKVFYYITMMGAPKLLCFFAFLIGLFLLLVKKDVHSFLFIMLTTIAGSLLNRGLKHIYERERPLSNELVDGTGYSFPSGHSVASMIFFGCCIYLIIKSGWNRTLKWLSSVLLALLIFLIGFSRVYFHVHYPSDVLGGFAFGFSFLLFSIYLFEMSRNSN